MVGDWSAINPQSLRTTPNSVHSGNGVTSAQHLMPRYSANDSFSHRSSHQRMVTRSPNHMWASSWATTPARFARSAAVARPR